MKSLISTAVGLAILLPFAGAARGDDAKDRIIFPTAKGSNLEGKEFILPADFEGDLNLVLVAFQREQQADVDTWLPVAEELEGKYEGLRYYELPTIRKVNRAYQWFINNGMRMGIKDPKARERTITLYLDKRGFRGALGLPHEGTIYALLVNSNGEVFWMVQGVSSKAKVMDLIKTIERRQPSSGARTEGEAQDKE